MEKVKGKLRVKVNGFEFDLDAADVAQADIRQTPDGNYHLLEHGRSHQIVVEQADEKKLRLLTNGQIAEIEIMDELDQRLDQMGFKAASTKQVKEVKAPMPGLVLDVSVTVGQEVKEGDRLLILGAMKMENSILIHADGVIKQVCVKSGQAVDKGQLLVELE